MNIVFFDGVCNLCNGAVNFLIDHDAKQRLRFASLQSEAGQAVLQKYGLPQHQYESFLLLKGDRLYQKSDAALEVARLLGGMWTGFYVFKLVPRFLRDAVYSWVARNRYRWFGKNSSCRMPTPELRGRFV
ncbi:thiol-disulfide oxidoreductase DCC family protein [Telluribacter sp. SYSU D00476]|uniref:thiol-disulfide oxidoreductase DCC family protein n=1 Tax=Telluribacter sp. SYSU D00476 TaxID=2811430 RepID=UPI001FF3BD7E|nr:thiol-disulfide oxidoreductase DCC family protein [Telluribacter sp. SYSU D00476]